MYLILIASLDSLPETKFTTCDGQDAVSVPQCLLSQRKHRGDFYLHEEKNKYQVIKVLETFQTHTYRCAKLKHISRVSARGAVMRTWSQNEKLNADLLPACARACCREKRSQKKKHFYLSLEKTFSWDFEYFSLKKKNEQNFEM